MKIWTSYFAKVRKLYCNILPVAITAYPPKWWKGDVYSKLAPTKEILFDYKNGLISEEEYTKRYREEVLDKLNPEEVYQELCDMVKERGYKEVCLVCFESSDKFCHRHIIAAWLREKLGIVVQEF